MTIKHAGIALIIGVILSFVSGLLFPGNALIDPVNQLDFSEAVGAIADAPALAHIMIYISIVGILLMIYAFVYGIYPLAAQTSGVGDTLLKFGIVLSIIEWTINIVGQGMRQIVVHLMQRSASAANSANSEDATLFSEGALDVYANMIAVFMSFIPLFPIASVLVGIGLISRMPATNLSKIGAYGLVVIGIAGFITYAIAMLTPANDPQIYLTVFNVILFVGAICFAALGYGMVKGDEGLTEES